MKSRTLDDYVDRLEAVVAGLASPFVWHGEAKRAKAVSLRFGDGARVTLTSASASVQKESLAAIVARAEPAPFGEGKKTKTDPRVRSALQIRADRKSGLGVEGFDPEASGILDEIRAALLPDLAARVRAELYALNVYGKGGHFVRHKDTPRGEDMIGTLVVRLPWTFAGGAFELERAGDRAVVDWARSRAGGTDPFPCVAFFGDVDHAIAEITSGHRITLSYVLRATPAKTAKKTTPAKAKAIPKRDAALGELLVEIADDDAVRKDGVVLRFPSLHQYAIGVSTAAKRAAEDAGPLKGRDATIASAAKKAGLSAELACCFIATSDGETQLDARLERAPSAKRLARLADLVKKTSFEHGGSLIEEIDALDAPSALRAVTVGAWDGATHVGDGWFSTTGFYGNEAHAAEFYVSAAIEITIPSRASGTSREVVHPKWGRGVVVETTGQGEERHVRIRFESGEERSVLERFLRS